MPAVLHRATANVLPLLSASLAAEQFLQRQVCTVGSILPTPGTLAIQEGRQGRPVPHSSYLLRVVGVSV